MKKTYNRFLLYLLLGLVACFWGGAFIAGKIALKEIPPFTLATIRFGLAAILLLLLTLYYDKGKAKAELSDLPWLALLGLTGVFGYNALFFVGLNITTAINGSLIVASNPIITTLLAALIIKEKIYRKQALGIMVSFSGVLLVISKGSLQIVTTFKFNPGDLLLIAAVFCWALYSIVGKKVMKKFSPLASTTYACVIGSILLLPLALYEGGLSNIFNYSLNTYIALFYMVIFASVLGFVWWYQGVLKVGASGAAIFINLVPISAMVMSGLFMGEKINTYQLLGAALVISGVLLTSIKGGTATKSSNTVEQN